MYKEILSDIQTKLLPLAEKFGGEFGLVGGTAIAMQIGHRRSIDFNLASAGDFDNRKIRKTVIGSGYKIGAVLQDDDSQFTFTVNRVQLTFLYYPFKIDYNVSLSGRLKMPDLLTLAAMKAYALGRRAKWKDYVDMYYIISNFYSIDKIAARSKKIYKGEFNEKIFREALSYFDDIDYSESVAFLPGFEIKESKIKKALVEFSLE